MVKILNLWAETQLFSGYLEDLGIVLGGPSSNLWWYCHRVIPCYTQNLNCTRVLMVPDVDGTQNGALSPFTKSIFMVEFQISWYPGINVQKDVETP